MPVLVRFTAIRSNSRFRGLITPTIREDLRFYTKDYIDELIGKATDVPPPPPPSPPNKYVRTGRYAAYMRANNISTGDAIAYNVTDPVQDQYGRYYAGFVGGSSQTWFHRRTGWPKLSALADQGRFQAGAQAIILKGIG